MAVAGVTANYNFIKPVFRGSFWHDPMWENLDRIDALIAGIAGDLDFVLNNWANSTAYLVTDRVVDPVDASSWQAVVAHTSGASPQTMAQYRAANPTHWVTLQNTIAVRGAWAQNTVYNVNDIVYSTSEHVYAICITNHTSTAVGTIRTDAVKWAYIADLQTYLTAVAASEAAAAASAAAAAASASGIAGVVTTHGDMIVRNATVAARLAIGTSGFVLKSQGAGAVPAWSRGPAKDLLIASSISAVANFEVPLDTYAGLGYQSFELVLHHIIPVNNGVILQMTASTDGGATFLAAAAYRQSYHGVAPTSFPFHTSAAATASFFIFQGTLGNGAALGGSATIKFHNPAVATYRPILSWEAMGIDSGGELNIEHTMGTLVAANDITDLKLAFSGGNIASCQYSLYGCK